MATNSKHTQTFSINRLHVSVVVLLPLTKYTSTNQSGFTNQAEISSNRAAERN